MKTDISILKNFGYFSYSSFIICIISGVILALGFDVSEPYLSLSADFITNRIALIVRSFHYWSANLFLIFGVLHIIDHIVRNTFLKVKEGIWLRLTLSTIAILYAMFSGFLLRGDIESSQARLIVEGIFNSIPWAGELISSLFFGAENDSLIIYIHHITTSTILIWLASIEHSKIIIPPARFFLKILPVIILIGILIIPSLHDPHSQIIKSPWYLLGMQESLYLYVFPQFTIILFSAFLILIFYLRRAQDKTGKILKKILLILLIIYSLQSLFAFLFRGNGWNISNPIGENSGITAVLRPFGEIFYESSDTLNDVPFARGRLEGCLLCHSEMSGFSSSHDPKAIGCSSCHLGDNMALNKDLAHKGMILVPGNIVHAKKTCGQSDCHSFITDNIHSSIMCTMSGVVSVNKWVFGESSTPDSLCNVMQIGHSPAETHLRNLCVSCHLQGIKSKPGRITQLSRGGGCNACHIDYLGKSYEQWQRYLTSGRKEFPEIHPVLNLQTTNDRCFGCHSRSGRISTHYEGWLELPEDHQIQNGEKIKKLADGRTFIYIEPDVHHKSGLLCIDCHSSYEIMGDGSMYRHKEDQVKIKCEDCHRDNFQNFSTAQQLDFVSARIAEIRNTYSPDRKYIRTEKSSYVLVNTFLTESGEAYLITKSNNDTLKLNPPASSCGKDIPGHSRLSCQSCHSSWTTSCVGCHNYYDKKSLGWDHILNSDVRGSWIEIPRNIEKTEPALGIIKDKNGKEEIKCFIPGMVLTIDLDEPEKYRRFKRLYAPAFSHTIQKQSRSCTSCHSNPYALGYGKGELKYVTDGNFGKWFFNSFYSKTPQDFLPEDSWIEFLSESDESQSTRSNARPFSLEEQKKILLVGSCFSCHSESEKKLLELFKNEKNYLSKLSPFCILPDFKKEHK